MKGSQVMGLFIGGLAAASVLVFALEYVGVGIVPPLVRTYVAGLSKLIFLCLACGFSARSAAFFEAGNLAGTAWRLLALGCLTFSIGQAILCYYVLVRQVPAPFPSVADVFFILLYPCFLAAVVTFVVSYRRAGYPLGSAAQHAGIAITLVALFTILGFQILQPILHTPAPPLATALNVAYPVLDFVLLIPTVALLRIALGFRGGQLWRIWFAILMGFVFMSAGDILFAYESLGAPHLNPLSHATFILGYALIARGAAYQYDLLKT